MISRFRLKFRLDDISLIKTATNQVGCRDKLFKIFFYTVISKKKIQWMRSFLAIADFFQRTQAAI